MIDIFDLLDDDIEEAETEREPGVFTPHARPADLLKEKGGHILAFDFETAPYRYGDKQGAINWRPVEDSAVPCVFAWAHSSGHSGAIDIRRREGQERMRELTSRVKAMAGHKTRRLTLVAHNLSFDYHLAVHHLGWPQMAMSRAGLYQCTSIRARVIGGEPSYALDSLSQRHLGAQKDDTIYEHLSREFGGPATRSGQGWRMCDADWPILQRYARIDAELTLRLFDWQERQIESWGLSDALGIETEAMPVFLDMEHRGIDIDEYRVVEYIAEADHKAVMLGRELAQIVGFTPNPARHADKEEMFGAVEKEGSFFTNRGSRLQLTDKGGASYSRASLEQMTDPEDKRIARLLIRLTDTVQLRDKFLTKQLLDNIRQGRIFPSLQQLTQGDETRSARGGTMTGRTSASSPPVQQLPSRGDTADKPRIMRECIIAPEGYSIVEGDYSSLEQRLAINTGKVKTIFDKYHADPAFDVYTHIGEMTGLERKICKVVLLAENFGMGINKLAVQIGAAHTIEMIDGRPQPVARDPDSVFAIRQTIRDALPGLEDTKRGIIEEAKIHGSYITPFGRRVVIDPDQSYKAFGCVGQSTGADIQKLYALSAVSRVLDGTQSRIFLQTHDSIAIYLHDDEHDLLPRIKAAAESVNETGRLHVPMVFVLNRPAENLWLATKGQE